MIVLQLIYYLIFLFTFRKLKASSEEFLYIFFEVSFYGFHTQIVSLKN